MSDETPTGRLIYLVDTETTGKDAGPDRLVEFACLPVWVPDVNNPCRIEIRTEKSYCKFVKPGEPISFGAMATHHITEEMVADALPISPVLEMSPLGQEDVQWPPVLAAHNAEFDAGFLKDALEEVRPADEVADPYWLDTLRCAKHLLPDAQGYSNQSLRYELRLEHPDLAPGGAHRASADALVTALLLGRLLEKMSLRELCRIQSEPVLLKSYGFGKHRGQPLADLPLDYLQWVANRSELGPDEKHTARTELTRRATEKRAPAASPSTERLTSQTPKLGSEADTPQEGITYTTGVEGYSKEGPPT